MKATKVFVLIIVLALLATLGGAAGAQEPESSGGEGVSASALLNSGCVAGSVYDPACDVDHDGDVDIVDIQLTASHWGHTGTYTASYWSLTGNSGTTPGTHFLGTTDNQALELRVNNVRALRLEPDATSPNVIGGYGGNSVTSGVQGATIGGGGWPTLINRVTDDDGTVGGGSNNQAGDNSGTTSGRQGATVGGGGGNTASGFYATIPGGSDNIAEGSFSFAAGKRAKANHDGAFVWGDSQDADVASTKTNQLVIRARGGVFLTENLGGGPSATLGERYRDNAIVAWGSVWGTTGAIDRDFGVNSVTRNGAGIYTVNLDISAADGSSVIPIAIAEIDSAPTSASALRIVSINQRDNRLFDVYINDGTGNLVDNDFVFIVTAR